MRSYNVTEFRENLAEALNQAAREPVIILRNGREYEIRLRPSKARRRRSGLDVPPIAVSKAATLDSVLDDLQAGRQRGS